jgi:flagellar hook-associated protein 1 FlgK
MASSILTIGSTALKAAQTGIATTSHNISNAATPGYSRQEIIQSSSLARYTGAGYIGQGVQVDTVRRIYNDFLANQVMDAQAASSQSDSQYSHISRINNLLADSTAGLSPVLQDFFAGIHDVTNDPADMSARQSMLSSTQVLINRFHAIDSQFSATRSEVEAEIRVSVETINKYAAHLATLNEQIISAESQGNPQPANDLRDQRDLLLADLTKEIRASVVRMDDGSINVYVAGGQALVLGSKSAKLVAEPSGSDNTQSVIRYQMEGLNLPLRESDIDGGRLGGLLEFRSDSLTTAQNTLGRMAIGLAVSFNQQHQLGQDLLGNPGGSYFSLVNPVAISDAGNTGSAEITASFVDVNSLTTSDYQIDYDGSNYTITRLSDGMTQTSAALPVTLDGMQINLSGGAIAGGDRFLLRPVREGAAGLGLAISNPAEIAAAAPIRTGTAASNTGTASISAGAVNAGYLASSLASAITLTYNNTTGMLSGFPAASAVTVEAGGTVTTYAAGAPVPYTAGAKISFDGIEVSLSGAPADGDTFTIQPNTGGVGDNRNALLLAGLQTARVLAGGTLNYGDTYSQLVSEIGVRTRELEITRTVQGKLLDEASNSQQSLSGVNLDEEAARLMQYQQAYQAAAKVMQMAGELFETLLSIG